MKMCKICNGWGDSIGDDDRCPRCTKRGYEPTAEYAADRTDRDEAPRATIQVEFTRRKDVVSYRIPGDNNWQSLNQCAPLANAARNLLEPEDNMYCQKCGDLLTYTYSAHGPCMRCESKPEVPEWFGDLAYRFLLEQATREDWGEGLIPSKGVFLGNHWKKTKECYFATAREAAKFAAEELGKVLNYCGCDDVTCPVCLIILQRTDELEAAS